ncbi:MAG: hypothetical protein QM662_06645 [Gordonia sp. (in: high G+C Gram-positive bacteria)]
MPEGILAILLFVVAPIVLGILIWVLWAYLLLNRNTRAYFSRQSAELRRQHRGR